MGSPIDMSQHKKQTDTKHVALSTAYHQRPKDMMQHNSNKIGTAKASVGKPSVSPDKQAVHS